MPKRKRDDDSLQARLEKLTTELFRTLKAAKAFERQRQSKRLRDPAATEEKKARIEREVVTLKSLDLHQASAAHIASSILKHKPLAADPSRLPEAVRIGVPKPENLTDEQRAALHNVTSSLYNQVAVKAVVEKAVLEVCRALRIEEPRRGKQKGERGVKGGKAGGQEEEAGQDEEEEKKKVQGRRANNKNGDGDEHDENDDEWTGFGSDGEAGSDKGGPLDQDDSDLEREEKTLAKYDSLVGNSDDSSDDDAPRKRPSTSRFTDDGISLSSHSPSPEKSDSSSSSSQASEASSPSSPNTSPAAKKAKGASTPRPTPKSKPQQPRPGSSTFLPTLMGGYISGSESDASDLDVAPVKKRLGQRQRQAIYEKKFGARANHVQKQQQQQQQQDQQQQRGGKRDNKGRGDGWDPRRGAIGAEDAGNNRRMPWKKGVAEPSRRGHLSKQEGAAGDTSWKPQRQERPAPPKQDGPLHPSWQAKTRNKEMEARALKAAKPHRIVFD